MKKKNRRAGEFDRGGKNENRLQQRVDVVARRVLKDFLHGNSAVEEHFLADELRERDRYGHDPQTSQLNQRQDDTLPEEGKIPAGRLFPKGFLIILFTNISQSGGENPG